MITIKEVLNSPGIRENAQMNADEGDIGTRLEKGIISAAMANAEGAAGYLPAKGQENVSLLQRQKQSKSGSQDFTFQCKSDSAEKMAQTQAPPAAPTFPRAPAAPMRNNKAGAPPIANGPLPPPAQYPAPTQPSTQQAAPPPKPRRDPDWWRRSAHRRKEQKQAESFHAPPDPKSPDDNYFCLFCEYEQIFGELPHYLGRQYEIKERRRRRERETNQKRLEAAKAKSRKGKKAKGGAKTASAPANAANNITPHAQPYDPAYTDPPQDDVSQGEDFFDDEYDEGIPAPAPLDTHGQRGHGAGVSHHQHHHHHPPPLPHGVDDLPELDRSKSLPTHM